MNKIIKTQLLKSNLVDEKFLDSNPALIIIPKQNQLSLKEDNCYLIEIDNSVLNPEVTSILASN